MLSIIATPVQTYLTWAFERLALLREVVPDPSKNDGGSPRAARWVGGDQISFCGLVFSEPGVTSRSRPHGPSAHHP